MHRFQSRAWLALTLSLALCVSVHARPWKGATGARTIEADFVSLVDGKVTLKKADGTLVTLAIDKLSAADQKLARELAAGEGETGASADANVELVSLAVSKPLDSANGLTTFGPVVNGGGTSLTFLVSAKDQHFVGFDSEGSKIVACTDDQGTDLSAASNDQNSFGFFGPFNASVSEDGQKCLVTTTVPGVPKTGAMKVAFEGTFTIRCGKDEKTEEQKDVALAAESTINVGPVPLTVESAQEQDFGDVKYMVTLNSSQPRDAIKQIEFLDAKGQPIAYDGMGSGSFGFGDQMTYQSSYGLKAKVEKVTVRVTYYANVETIQVPVKIATGVGL